MPLKGYVGSEPVQVDPDRFGYKNSRLKRNKITLPAAGTLTYMSPRSDQIWADLTIQAELQCSAIVAQRGVHVYFRDEDGDEQRLLIMGGTAGSVSYAVGTKATSIGSGTYVAGYGTVFTFPIYSDWIPARCAYGIRGDNLQAGDVLTFSMIYSEVDL